MMKAILTLLYFSHKELSPYDRFILAGELASVMNREVNLVDIKQIDTVLTMQIFEQGIPIYIQDEKTNIIVKECAHTVCTLH